MLPEGYLSPPGDGPADRALRATNGGMTMKSESNASMSRRAVVAGAAVSCATVGVMAAQRMTTAVQSTLLRAGSKSPPAAAPTGSAEMTGWNSFIGSTFQLTGASGSVTARLTKVQAMNAGGVRPVSIARTKAFGLQFDVIGPALQKGDGFYSLSGPGIATSELFFSRAPMQLVAIFN